MESAIIFGFATRPGEVERFVDGRVSCGEEAFQFLKLNPGGNESFRGALLGTHGGK